jgi:hypothetical protein
MAVPIVSTIMVLRDRLGLMSFQSSKRIFRLFIYLGQPDNHIPLRRPKKSIFSGQGPVQGPREEVQGPCARATKRGARASGFSKTLNQAFSTILLSVQFH